MNWTGTVDAEVPAHGTVPAVDRPSSCATTSAGTEMEGVGAEEADREPEREAEAPALGVAAAVPLRPD